METCLCKSVQEEWEARFLSALFISMPRVAPLHLWVWKSIQSWPSARSRSRTPWDEREACQGFKQNGWRRWWGDYPRPEAACAICP